MSNPGPARPAVPEGLKRCAVICVLRHRTELLLLERAREPNRGLFTPLGGKLDRWEAPRAAAIREIREEAGLADAAVRLAGTLVETAPGAYNWWSAVYVAEIARIPLPPCAEGILHWVPREGLGAVPMPATDRHLYDYLDRGAPFALSAEYDAELRLLRLEEELSGRRLV